MAEKKLEVAKLTGAQKAAVFLLKMGEEYSSEIFKKMNEHEIKRAAISMAAIDQIPREVLSAVMEEFVVSYEDESRMIVKGEAFLKLVVVKGLGDHRF